MKEFGGLADCDPVVNPEQLELNEASRLELEELKWRDARKNMELLTEYANRKEGSKGRKLFVEFYTSPKEIVGEAHVEGVIFERNRLAGEAGGQWAEGTGETFLLECGVFFRSVGYRGVPIEGVPFEERKGVFPNAEGRIVKGDNPVPGLYAVGWIKRGPSGVIGTNKPDSVETAKHVLGDIGALEPCARPDTRAVRELLASRGVKVVDYDAWKRIDAAEVARGQAAGKPREKFVSIDEMIDAAGE
jgi:ferredoxin--NADP+ reductase